MSRKPFLLGCEALLDNPPQWFSSARLGLLANQASIDQSFEQVRTRIREAGGHLRCLFSPQHGFYAEKQANMIESCSTWDGTFNIPVFSLYGDARQPTAEMLEHIDVLLVDLQDVGTRVYTYGTTLGLCLEAAGRAGVKVVVLDRPNPINGAQAEGNVLDREYRSFVGRYPVPMRHGLTLGELARFIVTHCRVPCEFEVIPMRGWKREDYFPDTPLPWVFPSPNMPSWETALVYPGMVLLEGCNVSEGRGTTLPFHCFGAPFLDHRRLGAHLKAAGLEGVVFRPICFEPVFDKWQGKLCYGFQIHITDRDQFRPYRLGLVLLQAFCQLYGEDFAWLSPPYEYEWEKLPIDILLGSGTLRKWIEDGKSLLEVEASWRQELEEYRALSEECWLY